MLRIICYFPATSRLMSLTIAIITFPSSSKRQKLHVLRFMIRLFIIERLFCKSNEVFNLRTEISIHTTLDKNFLGIVSIILFVSFNKYNDRLLSGSAYWSSSSVGSVAASSDHRLENESYCNSIEPVIPITFLAQVILFTTTLLPQLANIINTSLSWSCDQPLFGSSWPNKGDNRLGTVILFVVTPVAFILYHFVVT